MDRDYIQERNEVVERTCKVVDQDELARELLSGFTDGVYKELRASYLGPDGDYLVYRVEKTTYAYDDRARHAERTVVDAARLAVRWRSTSEG